MAKVYVGTYHKYNDGDLTGAWLDLAKYETYQDFLKACHELHADERDPEFMIQDSEDFPDGLAPMEWMSEQEFNDVKQAMREEEKPAVQIVDYSEKAIAVIGDTKSIRDQLKAMGGKFNSKLSCGAGWIFSKKRRAALEAFLSTGITGTDDFQKWLDEYLSTANDSRKYYLGAIKIQGGYYLLDKPSIETKFCFHDEGPQYEYYKTLRDDERLKAHFLSENLASFDNPIDHITEGDFGDIRVWWRKDGNRVRLSFDYRWVDDSMTLCTESETQLILKGLRYAREAFSKRLESYLKRYGTSKIHTWTYWADR